MYFVTLMLADKYKTSHGIAINHRIKVTCHIHWTPASKFNAMAEAFENHLINIILRILSSFDAF